LTVSGTVTEVVNKNINELETKMIFP